MIKTGIYPGTFDPLTFGHLNVIKRSLKIVDKLIIGAYIEARSCERFAKLAPHLDEDLHKFYF